MEGITGKFIDGGLVFTITLLMLFFAVLVLIVWGFIRPGNHRKIVLLMTHVGWFAVAWGFLGRTFGLIKAFDMVAAYGELTPSLLAGGMKMALVDPLFGIFVFLVARLGIIILVAKSKEVNLK